METETEHVRFYIFKSMKLEDSPMQIHQELQSVYETSCSYDTVFKAADRHGGLVVKASAS